MKGHILLIDDEPNIVKTMSMSLRTAGYEVTSYSEPEIALQQIEQHPEQRFTLALVDLMMYPIDGKVVLQQLKNRFSDLPIIIITAHATVETAVETLKLGAYDYLQKPFDQKELLTLVSRVVHIQQLRELRSPDAEMLTNDPNMLSILATAKKIAGSDLTVLIEGETGTGKELFADYIHKNSSRASGPLVKLNCTTLSGELIESELFGHVKGSFTSAIKDRIGRVEAADGGTLFLDEIGEMALASQAKLLRFLQNREFQRVGENVTRTSDVRIVAATNRNLEQEIEHGNFREDLFYRLSVFRILVPPLRHRKGDVLLLAKYFVSQTTTNGIPPELSAEVKDALMRYDFRGNVRELENAMVRATVLASGERTITLAHLPEYIARSRVITAIDPTVNVQSELESLEQIEHKHIAYILSKTSSLEEAARILGIDSATLWRKRKKFGL